MRLGREQADMSQSDSYRWIVRVEGHHLRADCAREVATDGPKPELAIKRALDRITKDDDNDLWQREKMTVTVERVR